MQCTSASRFSWSFVNHPHHSGVDPSYLIERLREIFIMVLRCARSFFSCFDTLPSRPKFRIPPILSCYRTIWPTGDYNEHFVNSQKLVNSSHCSFLCRMVSKSTRLDKNGRIRKLTAVDILTLSKIVFTCGFSLEQRRRTLEMLYIRPNIGVIIGRAYIFGSRGG
jgi:hypothetical protein